MIHDKKIQILHDFSNSGMCFTGVDIKGGVCYFLRNNTYEGKCTIYHYYTDTVRKSIRYLAEENENIYIREDRLIAIKNKVKLLNEPSFETIVSSRKPYGLGGDVFNNTNKYKLPPMYNTPKENNYKILGLEKLKRVYKYIPIDYPIPNKSALLNKWKLFITRNWGIGSFDDIPSMPVIAGPGELCTETFLEIGPFENKSEVQNVYSYICTKFFRALVAIRKQDQGASKAVYHYVPLQDFSKPWTDEELYKKYKLNQDEIDFIEAMVKPMDLGGDING